MKNRATQKTVRCAKCGGTDLVKIDGGKIGSFPGITYIQCQACGYENKIDEPPAPKPTTRTIAGHPFTLTPGRRFQATRPMAERGVMTFDVTVRDITDGFVMDSVAVATVPGLSYDEANALLAAFNDGESSFAGRVW